MDSLHTTRFVIRVAYWCLIEWYWVSCRDRLHARPEGVKVLNWVWFLKRIYLTIFMMILKDVLMLTRLRQHKRRFYASNVFTSCSLKVAKVCFISLNIKFGFCAWYMTGCVPTTERIKLFIFATIQTKTKLFTTVSEITYKITRKIRSYQERNSQNSNQRIRNNRINANSLSIN